VLQTARKKWKRFWACGALPPDVRQVIDRDNMRFGLLVAAISALLEFFMLIRYGVFGNRASDWYWYRVWSYTVFFTASVCMSLFSMLALDHKIKKHWVIMCGGVAYCVVALGWSIFISAVDYSNDGQILVFCTIVLGFTGFSFWHPSHSIFLYLASFGAFYAILYRIDRADRLNIYNYVIFLLICFLVSASRYHMKVNSTTAQLKLEKMGLRFRRLSLYDELTGLMNRRSLFLRQEECTGQTMFLMMMDLDNFKAVNDLYGHSAGDEALRQFAAILRRYFPPECVYRYGGEEFVVALCGGCEADILEKIEKSRSDVGQICVEGRFLGMTFSGGYVTALLKNREDFEQLLRAADMALYEAKRRGKNCVAAGEMPDDETDFAEQTTLPGCFEEPASVPGSK